jgi:predicted phage terminase large subunit-like protein
MAKITPARLAAIESTLRAAEARLTAEQDPPEIIAAREDFYAFRRMMNPSHKSGWWQQHICRALQRFWGEYLAGRRPKMVIQAPPQHGKSDTINDFIAWIAGQNPNVKTIYASFSEDLGVRANLGLQRKYDGELYHKVFPFTNINSSNILSLKSQYLRNRSILEYVRKTGYFRNTTVRGAITGQSLDIGIIDDPIKGRADANSITVRDTTWDWFTNDFTTRFSDGGALLIILTRWHVDDPVGRLIQKVPGIEVVSYPAIATQDEEFRRKGEALFPEHKSLEFLQGVKAIMPPGDWEALYQQNPIISDGGMFKPDMLVPIGAIPVGKIKWVRGWDLAATLDGDFTSGGRMGKLEDGRHIITDVTHGRWRPDERDAIIRNTTALDGRDVAVSLPQDPAQAGYGQAQQLARMLSGYTVHTSAEKGDKADRATPLASQINAGNVLALVPDPARPPKWLAELKDDMRIFPNGRKDLIDSLSRAFSWLNQGQAGMGHFEYMKAKYGGNVKN